jgi:hypothetical protein
MPQAVQSTPDHRVYSKAELTKVRRSTLLYARSFPPGPEQDFHRQVALSLRSLFRNEAWLFPVLAMEWCELVAWYECALALGNRGK